MSTTTTNTNTNKLTVKLFVGCSLSSELKMNLNQSKTWKQASIVPASAYDDLIEIHFHGKDFVGSYLSTDKITVAELQTHEAHLRERLQHYCPAFDLNGIKPCVFAQVFIA